MPLLSADPPTPEPPPGRLHGLPYDAEPLRIAPIQTERLFLRPLANGDAADVWAYQQLDEVIRYLPWPRRTAGESAEHTRERSGMTRLELDGESVILACVLPDAAGERVIGDVMLRLTSVENAQLEIGWVLHPDFKGHGYAREAAPTLIRLAIDSLGAHRVYAKLDPRNTASAALSTRLGMRHEGTLVQEIFNKDEWCDTAIYGILCHEWRAIEDAEPHTP